MTWIAPLATFGLPIVFILLAAWLFAYDQVGLPLALLLGTFPLGLASGYLLIGLPWRGLAVVAGGYLLLALCAAFMFNLPTQFEDAGVVVMGGAVLVALVLGAYAGWGAWDVHHRSGTQRSQPGG